MKRLVKIPLHLEPMPADTLARAYIARVYEAWPINPFNARDVVMFDNVIVEVHPGFEPDEVRLSAIYALETGKGWASKALDWLLDLADEMNVKLGGTIVPFGRQKRFTAKQLWEWEKRHGFVQDQRSPRGYRGRSVIYYPGSRRRAT